MLLHDARRQTRLDDGGDLILLADQDRARWDRAQIDEGVALVEASLRRAGRGRAGPYQLQAAIAALHAAAPSAPDTDWPQIAAIYGELARIASGPVVELNRAVAVAMADGPQRGLDLLDTLGDDLADQHLYHAARADLLARLGRAGEAADAYRRAADLATTTAERRFLERRLERLG
jgi:RNA polymerase sigma-70 factor (ECF subfamily)